MREESPYMQSLKAAAPIMAGSVAIGLACGFMESHIGMNALMAFCMSMTFYSGAGQFMIAGMWLAGSALSSIIASVSFVNTRQVLYSAAFAPYFEKVSRGLTFLFSATVTDESFGVNMRKYQEGDWDAKRALFVNLFSMTSWGVSNAVGVLLGDAMAIPTAIAAFAMTSIFICLLTTQKWNKTNIVVAAVSMAGVLFFKFVGLGGAAILLGACVGVGVGWARWAVSRR